MKKSNITPQQYLEIKACMANMASHFLSEEFEKFLKDNWERMERNGIYEFDDILNFYIHPTNYEK